MNNAPASWTAVTSEAKSPLWLRLSERLGPSPAPPILLKSESGDSADSVAAVQKLAPSVADKATIRGLNLCPPAATNQP